MSPYKAQKAIINHLIEIIFHNKGKNNNKEEQCLIGPVISSQFTFLKARKLSCVESHPENPRFHHW
jgi:hypothetical protein